jgi:hypothetical protein
LRCLHLASPARPSLRLQGQLLLQLLPLLLDLRWHG